MILALSHFAITTADLAEAVSSMIFVYRSSVRIGSIEVDVSDRIESLGAIYFRKQAGFFSVDILLHIAWNLLNSMEHISNCLAH